MPLRERLTGINNHLLYLEETALVYFLDIRKVNDSKKHIFKSKGFLLLYFPQN